MSFLVRVPATTANLGPGFDCLGLALDLWNEVDVSCIGNRLEIVVEGEGMTSLPIDQTNSIFRTMQAYAKRHNRELPQGLQLRCQNNIPLGSGLGSSSAAIIAGILAASAILEIPEDKSDQLDFATQMEGHPDNVAPCLSGGLVASILEADHVVSRKLPIYPFSFVIVTPDFVFPTHQARAALPISVPRSDAVFNLSHAVLSVEALKNGDFDLLATTMQDQLHQPYRLPLIPGAIDAISAAKQAGAIAVVLSGAGPSLLAILRQSSDSREVGAAMMDAFHQAGLNSRVFTLISTESGASIIRI